MTGTDRLRILVLCTGNSCRSRMAEGFLRSLDSDLEVHSAGTKPAPLTNPNAVRVMKEIGIDISNGHPKHVRHFLGQSFFAVITVCANAERTCPRFDGKVSHRIHIGFEDPAKAEGAEPEVLGVFRRIRDEIKVSFEQLYNHRIKGAR